MEAWEELSKNLCLAEIELAIASETHSNALNTLLKADDNKRIALGRVEFAKQALAINARELGAR
jgi:hypothetical protein